MLVLTRRLGESIQIGDDVVVTLLDVQGSQVRVGIRAPGSVKILRTELLAARRVQDIETLDRNALGSVSNKQPEPDDDSDHTQTESHVRTPHVTETSPSPRIRVKRRRMRLPDTVTS